MMSSMMFYVIMEKIRLNSEYFKDGSIRIYVTGLFSVLSVPLKRVQPLVWRQHEHARTAYDTTVNAIGFFVSTIDNYHLRNAQVVHVLNVN